MYCQDLNYPKKLFIWALRTIAWILAFFKASKPSKPLTLSTIWMPHQMLSLEPNGHLVAPGSQNAKYIGGVRFCCSILYTSISDRECQHATRRFESIRMLLNKQTGWHIFAQLHPTLKLQDDTKNNSHKISQLIGSEKINDMHEFWGIAPQDKLDVRVQSQALQQPTLKNSKHSGSEC